MKNRKQRVHAERFGVSFDFELLKAFDHEIGRAGYTCRSEALRDLVRRWLAERHLYRGRGSAVAALALVYEHDRRDVVRRLTRLGHEHYTEIISTLHIHLDPHHCLEVLLLRGPVRRIQALADRLSALKGVEQGSVSMIALGQIEPGLKEAG
uniref:Putative nickel-responsive regulator n=1 Tax=candidate division WOR-3 bacterium TaxID=2052148 RepID=A0A7C1T264_UNCW3